MRWITLDGINIALVMILFSRLLSRNWNSSTRANEGEGQANQCDNWDIWNQTDHTPELGIIILTIYLWNSMWWSECIMSLCLLTNLFFLFNSTPILGVHYLICLFVTMCCHLPTSIVATQIIWIIHRVQYIIGIWARIICDSNIHLPVLSETQLTHLLIITLVRVPLVSRIGSTILERIDDNLLHNTKLTPIIRIGGNIISIVTYWFVGTAT
mgnify:CR=1 FL=1